MEGGGIGRRKKSTNNPPKKSNVKPKPPKISKDPSKLTKQQRKTLYDMYRMTIIARIKGTKVSGYDIIFTEMSHDHLMKVTLWKDIDEITAYANGTAMTDILTYCHYYKVHPLSLKYIIPITENYNPFFIYGYHINDDFFVFKMFGTLKSLLFKRYEHETPIEVPCRIGNTFLNTGINNANVKWFSDIKLLYAYLASGLSVYSERKGKTNRVNFVCDAEYSIISKAIKSPILPNNFDIHLLFSNSTYADPGPCMSFGSNVAKSPLARATPNDQSVGHDNKKYLHYYKEYKHVKDENRYQLNGGSKRFDGSKRENLSMFRWGILRELEPPNNINCQIKQRTDMGPNDVNNMKDANTESTIQEIKKLAETASDNAKKAQNGLWMVEAARIYQLKRLGDHLQKEFVLWLDNNNDNQPITNDPYLEYAKRLENIESYESTPRPNNPLKGVLLYIQDYERNERNTPFVRHKNTYFVTHDWPAFCFAVFNGINCIYRSDDPPGFFICTFDFPENQSIPPQPPPRARSPFHATQRGGLKLKKQKKNKTKKRKTLKKKRIFKS
jgi:hypothetical protein